MCLLGKIDNDMSLWNFEKKGNEYKGDFAIYYKSWNFFFSNLYLYQPNLISLGIYLVYDFF